MDVLYDEGPVHIQGLSYSVVNNQNQIHLIEYCGKKEMLYFICLYKL